MTTAHVNGVPPRAKAERATARTPLEPPTWQAPPDLPAKKFGNATAVLSRHMIHGVEAADAVAVEPVDWLWETYIVSDSYVLFGGRPGEGKTTLACLFAVAAAAPVAEPVRLLGRVVRPVADGEYVFLVLEENSPKSAVEQIDRAIEAWGLDRASVWSRIVLLPRAGVHARKLTPGADDVRRPTDQWSAIVHVAVEQEAIGLLVIDSMARVFGRRSANQEEDQAEVGEIVTTLQRRGVTVVVIVHVRKGGSIELEDIAGSHQRVALADAVLAVEGKKKKGKTIATRVRVLKQREITDDWPEPQSFAIAKHEGTWTLSEDGAQEPDAEGRSPADRIYAVLDEADKPMSQAQIRKALDMSGRTVAEGMRTLGRRVKSMKTKRGGQDVTVYEADPSWDEVLGGTTKR